MESWSVTGHEVGLLGDAGSILLLLAVPACVAGGFLRQSQQAEALV